MSQSTSTTPTTPTAAQPAHSLSNIVAHPGSSWAGAGIVLATVAQAINAQSLPTTAAGWVTFFGSLAVAVMAALGK